MSKLFNKGSDTERERAEAFRKERAERESRRQPDGKLVKKNVKGKALIKIQGATDWAKLRRGQKKYGKL